MPMLGPAVSIGRTAQSFIGTTHFGWGWFWFCLFLTSVGATIACVVAFCKVAAKRDEWRDKVVPEERRQSLRNNLSRLDLQFDQLLRDSNQMGDELFSRRTKEIVDRIRAILDSKDLQEHWHYFCAVYSQAVEGELAKSPARTERDAGNELVKSLRKRLEKIIDRLR